MFGLVVSPPFLPSLNEVEALRPALLRSILYHVDDCWAVSARSRPYLVTVNNEGAEVKTDWSGWDDAIKQIANLPNKPWAVEVGNEFDLFWQNNPHDVPPEFAADLIQRASVILRPRGIKVIATSVAGGRWPEYLDRLASLCRSSVDYFNLHPYGQRPTGWGVPGWGFGDLKDAITTAHGISGRPIYCTEIGVTVGMAGGEQQQAAWLTQAAQTLYDLGPEVCEGASIFAWKDQIGAPWERGPSAFGLRRDDDSRRPGWYAFQELPSRSGEEMPVFTVGDGVKAQMAFYGDEPGTDEIYHPIGASQGKHQYSETFGKSGRRYVYIFSNGKTVTYAPEAPVV
jgi:hypothetical protein